MGGYGVFGSWICGELAGRGATVTVAGRDGARAAALARSLGPGHRGVRVDARDAAQCRAALAGHAVAVYCAGPFAPQERTLLEACLESGCHYVDIADDRGYAAMVRAQHARFRERGLAAAFGCSSLPGISVALALVARGDRLDAPRRARVTLFIGNDNAKSETAVRSVIFGLGRVIPTPQGTLRGFREQERVDLPPPFGRRTAYAFESPDYDLLPDALGVRDVRVLVGFESRAAGPAFSALARLGPHWGPRTARLVARIGRLSRAGSSGGVVLSELTWSDGTTRRAGLYSERDGQRLAALPAAIAARALETGAATARGACTAYDLIGAETLASQVAAAGFQRLG